MLKLSLEQFSGFVNELFNTDLAFILKSSFIMSFCDCS